MTSEKDREILITNASQRLREENDDEALQAITGLIKAFTEDETIRQGVMNLHRHGYAFLQTSKDAGDHGPNLTAVIPSSSKQQMVPTLSESKELKSKSRLNHEHPLLNDLVLKKIFQYCSLNTLKTCRLVSPKWRDASLDAWRSKAVLVICRVDTESWEVVLDGFGVGGIPFKRYNASCRKGVFSELFHLITNNFATSVKYLNLTTYRSCVSALKLPFFKLPDLQHFTLCFSHDDFIHELQGLSLKGDRLPELSTPHRNLKSLELRMYPDVYFSSAIANINIHWKRMFEDVPNLERLCMSYVDESNRGGQDWRDRQHVVVQSTILKALLTARTDSNHSSLNLKELIIQLPVCGPHDYLGPEMIESIIESKFPLERFTMDFGMNMYTERSRVLLETHASTLEYLEGNQTPKQDGKFTSWPLPTTKLEFPKLKEIVLKNGFVWGLGMLATIGVPNLEKLIFKKDLRHENIYVKFLDLECNCLDSLLRNIQFLQNVTVFKYDGHRLFSPYDLSVLAKAMPNVEDLEIVVTAETFSVVCRSWPKIKTFRTSSSDEHPPVDDEAITGIPMDVDESAGAAALIPRRPNIADLKDLTHFVLLTSKTDLARNFVVVTDHSAIHGFLRLPRLQSLDIAFRKLAPNVRAALEHHVQNLVIRKTRR